MRDKHTVTGLVLMALATLALASCSMLPQAWLSPAPHLPTAQQILGACNAEKAAGTPQAKAPDCVQYYILKTGCDAASIGQAVNGALPLVATVNPIAGSVLSTSLSIDKAICAAQGFYQPAAGALESTVTPNK